MSTTAFPTVIRTDYSADKAVTTSRAKGLRDRGEVLIRQAWQVYFAEVSTSSASDVLLATMKVAMPEYVVDVLTGSIATRRLSVTLQGKVGTAGATGRFTLKDTTLAGTRTGTAVDVTGTAYAELTLTLDYGFADVLSALHTLEFRGFRFAGSGSVFLQSINRCTAWWMDV